ncbi:hypothetical protein GH741_07505 [Aquibacillus halophilus]|uniref:Uncharacterized protein n=1 Tax=Aquibacillus halophilus TaxID=930132 RepID=A0A6A8DAA8_9BACI|nr:nucleotidyltransferase domain-containing protein [Aquibacillus halophilus]MRH42528.1 hypothetical protein [Aquibacillus halophilus]
MVETLFIPEQFILKQSKYGELLREERKLFLSLDCYYAFGGYAKDQLMRIKNGLDKASPDDQNEHLKYTMNQMLKEIRNKYQLPNEGKLSIGKVYFDGNEKQNIDVSLTFDSIPLTQLNEIVSQLSNSLKGFNKINNRNRKPKEKMYKHAMHLFRLLLIGIEVLETGGITVFREKDREFLLAIRQEKYSWN